MVENTDIPNKNTKQLLKTPQSILNPFFSGRS